MIDDPEERHSGQLHEHLLDLLEEENHYKRLRRVFGTPDGVRVFEWLLESAGYWKHITDERSIGKFEFARFVFDQICVSDVGICHEILNGRRERAERNRMAEKKKIEDKIKGEKP